MTAQWVDDEPIPYELTAAGWAAVRAATAPRTAPRVPAGPLLRQIALRGGEAACGVRHRSAEQKSLERARLEGSITLWMADRLAVRLLGLTVWDLWPDAS